MLVVSPESAKDLSRFHALDKVLESTLRKAESCGLQITTIIHKTDRPSSQFWNSRMVRGHRELARKHGVNIRQITEQSCHNKDTADGEFSVVKTALNQHLLRSDNSSSHYTEVKTSKQIKEFGEKHLSSPGTKAGIKERVFLDLLPDTILQKKEEDSKNPNQDKTLQGISSQYEIICQVSKQCKTMFT